MKLTEALSFVFVSLTLGVLGVLIQMFFPGVATVLMLSTFCMILAVSIIIVGSVSLLCGCHPTEFSGKMIFKGMLLPLLYLLVGIIFVEAMTGASGKSFMGNILDWIGLFFVLGMCFCIPCCKKCR